VLAASRLVQPVLGMFAGFDWIDFLAAREERHLRQVRGLIRSPG
jgi:hypothetical protein